MKCSNSIVVLGVLALLAVGCGKVMDGGSQASSLASDRDEAAVIDRQFLKYNEWDQQLLEITSPIHFDQCSHHSSQNYLRVTRTVLGFYGVELEVKTYYGHCTAYSILNLETAKFYKIAAFGETCPSGQKSMPAPSVFEETSTEYQEAFADLKMKTADVEAGFACYGPRPELDNLNSYLEFMSR
jgi:hypothetical protein